MILALKNYIISQGTTETIYTGFLPPSPDTAIVLYETAGYAPDAKHQYNSLGIQVKTRAKDYMTARGVSYRIFDTLQSFSSASTGITISGGIFITDIQAIQDPYALGRDDFDRSQFVQNFLVEYNLDLAHRA
jgi:hypothetical protein